MKVGDTIPVTISGQTVAQATVKEMEEGKATLVVPATLVVMATRTELSVEAPVVPEKETIITGVDRPEGESAPVVEAPVVQAPPASAEAPPPAPVENTPEAGTETNNEGSND